MQQPIQRVIIRSTQLDPHRKHGSKSAPTMESTKRQREFLVLTWHCFKTEPVVDYTKLATLAGLDTKSGARGNWSTIKKALISLPASNDGRQGTDAKQSFKISKPSKERGPSKSTPQKRLKM
ncbi:hypothetical protein DOTSEDRAFT_33321 [Dothistroma septosporum NZE10]|uniref:Uncharacterized protein n=1 Tax=Dothistroma septosporum (strain NZE10 / CBS 128990) TaxID=675120 RepID=N1PWJ8_DOTSN|nr:hypothetical protein DOTSEDRAFT_33321 [Dothistroma septosporum NZE10]